MSAVAVADCGVGNLHSVLGAIARIAPAAEVVLTDDAAVIAKADKVILPGDGNFDACMRAIDERDLRGVLREAATAKPFWGICAGMQALFAGSEEGGRKGLGVFSECVRKLPPAPGLKIPHMGWNRAKLLAPQHPMLAGIAEGERFYFVHSYYAAPDENTVAAATHGAEICAMRARGDLFATQFHPEKSGAPGEQLLRNFLTG